MLVLAAGNFECMPNVVVVFIVVTTVTVAVAIAIAVIVTPNSEMCNDNAAVSVLAPHFRQLYTHA